MLIEQDRLAYSIEELSKVSGKTAPALRADIYRGRLPARKWGRRTVVLREDAVAFLQGLPLRRIENEAERGVA